MANAEIKNLSQRREPAVLLQPVIDPAAWTAADLDADKSWIHPLDDRDIAAKTRRHPR